MSRQIPNIIYYTVTICYVSRIPTYNKKNKVNLPEIGVNCWVNIAVF